MVLKHFRVVLVSPSDVQAERNALRPVIDIVNRMLRVGNDQVYLEPVQWETDAYQECTQKGQTH